MQRPIPATRSLSREDARAALKSTREHLKTMGYTRKPYEMCAEIDNYGVGFAVFVGFQPDADLHQALSALARDSTKASNHSVSWGFSLMTHSMCPPRLRPPGGVSLLRKWVPAP